METNNYSFTYTNYETKKFGKKLNIFLPKEYNFEKFIHNTSICTSTMILRKKIAKKGEFTNTKSCEDYFYKCKMLKFCNAYCLDDFLTKYRLIENSIQKSGFYNLHSVWTVNRENNKLNIFQKFFSLLFISLNSIKKYGFKTL